MRYWHNVRVVTIQVSSTVRYYNAAPDITSHGTHVGLSSHH